MDKPTSIIAAFNAGKIPSTQQFNEFIDYLQHVGIVKVQREAQATTGHSLELSAQGKVLADDLRDMLRADRKLLNDKNADNILQEAIWHLAQGTITTSSSKIASTKKGAQQDIDTIRQSLRTLFKALYHSFSSERTTLFGDLLSFIRTSLSDALQVVEGKAGEAKEGLRKMEGEVQKGKRDQWGRDIERLEEERKDPKVAWEHGVEKVKVVGSSAIGGAQGAQETLEQGQEKAEGELKKRYYLIWKRAQSDPEYRQALDTLFSLLQDRLHAALDTADPTKTNKNITLSTFIVDPTPEQHIPKGINLLRTFIERLAGKSLGPVVDSFRNAMAEVLQDERLRTWFDEFFEYSKKVLENVHYAPKSEAKAKRKDLRGRWLSLSSAEENPKWHALVEKVKAEVAAFEKALKEDEDLREVKEAKEKFGEDLKNGLSERVGEGVVEQAVEEITWFWQDLFKVYLPNVLGQLKELPIPRTEYKDEEIEFVLENLDISRLNILPSRVYIRNITDISIQTSENPSIAADKQLATLTHIKLEALQMHLKDVSFWYKDKQATVMDEFTGLLEMKLPPQGINVDLKVRMIPAKAKGKISREEQRRFHVVERCAVEISDDVEVTVRESNHPMVVNVFSGLVKRRVKEAMEKTLTGQFRGLVDWVDGVAYDVGERRKVFEDAGLGGGPGVVAAIWSEIGRMEREGGSMGVKATGTGIIFEEEGKERVLAVGAEPQVLGGEKRGPLGTGSESVRKTVEGMMEERGMSMDVDVGLGAVKGVGEMVEEGKRRVEGFRKAVLRKERDERKSVGKTWKSDAFDF